MIPQLETPRLVMRGWREEDLDAHAAMSADPEVQRYLEGGQCAHLTLSGATPTPVRLVAALGRSHCP